MNKRLRRRTANISFNTDAVPAANIVATTSRSFQADIFWQGSPAKWNLKLEKSKL